jgi:methylated-DNA-[protein]-cysteine S-methyltransferase
MTAPGYCLFDTAIGACAVAWGDRGLKGVQLPEADPAKTRARMTRRFADIVEAPPPADVRDAIAAITALVSGEPRDLSGIPLDMDGLEDLPRAVYEIARTIRPGQTLTYGEIARRLGDVQHARAVGEALGRNPFAIVVPCHRVLAAGGKLGGFSANGGVVTKLRLLQIEGAQIGDDDPGLFDDLPMAVRAPPRR